METEPQQLVMTWGVFDLLHPGHLSLLRRARKLGDRLLVAINSDESAERIKGRPPIYNQLEREYSLRHLRAVDEVVVFSDDDASMLLLARKPAIAVKAADWNDLPFSERTAMVLNNVRYVDMPILRDWHASRLREILNCDQEE